MTGPMWAQVGYVIDGCDSLTHPRLGASRKWLGGLMARGRDRLERVLRLEQCYYERVGRVWVGLQEKITETEA